MKIYLQGYKIILTIGILLVLSSCKSLVVPVFSSQLPPAKPNYHKQSSWAVLPNAYPKNLIHWQTNREALQVDVFYIYPTLNIDEKDLRWNIPISDFIQNEKVINKAVYYQASAFLNSGNLYVPYYRQAHLRSYSQYDMGGREALELAYIDIKNAFEIYLEYYNKGKPIIIASHSQGTTHAIRLLKDFFDGKPLQSKLIAAYIPGIAIRKEVFKYIYLMKSPTETGGFVSWNTYKNKYYPKTYNEWFKGVATSNPITWDDKIVSQRKDHKGFLFTNDKLYKQALKVYVKDGILWTTLPHFPYRIFALGKKRYHTGDINLFWEDIRENAMLRVKSYYNRIEIMKKTIN